MHRFFHSLFAMSALAMAVIIRAADQPPIDPARGRQLMEKSRRGESLTSDEQAYLERVKQVIRERAVGKQREIPKTTGRARPVAPNPSDWNRLVPITDMLETYKGEDGGLYGGGRNQPPPSLRSAHLAESAKVVPRDAGGNPSSEGKIGFITIGFSNPSIESEDFKRAADADPQKSPHVIIVNGCIGGRSAVMWAWDGADVLPREEQVRLDRAMDVVRMPKGKRAGSGQEKDTWPTLANRIAAAGVSAAQVQVCWLKHVEANPKPFGEFPAHARALQADISAILNIARHHYPNLRIVYLSSRTFGGWSGRESGSPEPYAYESGFGTRWVVQSQLAGSAELNFDPARGPVKAPLALWGPYLWARGDAPRQFDGLTWTQDDVRADQLHPSEAGCKKTTQQLLKFFKTDEGAARWFLQSTEKPGLAPRAR